MIHYTTKTYHETLTDAKGYDAMKEFANSQLDDKNRFAQGELYYALGDYETAIFKWQQVKEGLLGEWGMKNSGDAYYNQQQYSQAERMYLTIQTKDPTLSIEKLLGLVKVYKKTEQSQKQLIVNRELVKLDVDYGTVYEDALAFFEQQAEYHDAFSLVMTKNKELTNDHIEKLLHYLKLDVDGKIKFDKTLSEFLLRLWEQANESFSSALDVLSSYMIQTNRAKEGLLFFAQTLKNDNCPYANYIMEHEVKKIVDLVDALYVELASLSELEDVLNTVIPTLVSIVSNTEVQDLFNSYLGKTAGSKNIDIYDLSDLQNLYSQLKRISSSQGAQVDTYQDYLLQHYSNHRSAMMLVGGYNSGKSSFINSILQSEVLKADIIPTTSAITILKYGKTETLTEWKDGNVRATSFDELEQVTTIHHEQSSKLSTSLIGLTVPNQVLREIEVNFIDTPGFFDDETNTESNPTFDYLPLADEVLVSLTADKPFSRKDKELVDKILNHAPTIQLSFMLNQVDRFDEDELEELLEDIERKIQKSFINKHPLNIYSSYEPEDYQEKVIEFLKQPRTLNVKERIAKMIPSMEAYIDSVKLNLNEQISKQVTLLNQAHKTAETFKNFVQSIEDSNRQKQNQLSTNIKQTFIQPLLGQIRLKIIQIIRMRVEDIDYHLHLQPLIEKINANINAQVRYFIEQQAYQHLQQAVLSWYQSQLKDMDDYLINLKQQSSRNVEERYQHNLDALNVRENLLENKITNLLQKLSSVLYREKMYITYDAAAEKWASGVGRLLGVQNNKDYLKIDKLKERLLVDTFDVELNHTLMEYEYIFDEFQKEFIDCMMQPCLQVEDLLEKQHKDIQRIVQQKASSLKKLKDAYPKKLSQWELVEAKINQLSLLYGGISKTL